MANLGGLGRPSRSMGVKRTHPNVFLPHGRYRPNYLKVCTASKIAIISPTRTYGSLLRVFQIFLKAFFLKPFHKSCVAQGLLARSRQGDSRGATVHSYLRHGIGCWLTSYQRQGEKLYGCFEDYLVDKPTFAGTKKATHNASSTLQII